MDAFFTWLSSNPTATVAVGIIVTTLSIIFLVAFFQGREISFWPPKIGSQPKVLDKNQELLQSFLTEKTGIVKTFDNLEACKTDMQNEFEKAGDVRLLLQLGRREFSDRNTSLFWNLAQQKNQAGTQIRILHASLNSPFLSKARAKFRGTPVEQWREDLRRLQAEFKRLTDVHHANIQTREHSEPYLWRIFIFDDVVYVSAYLYQRNNDTGAPVYKMKKGDVSLYAIFNKYFDYLWMKYDPTSSENPSERWSNWA